MVANFLERTGYSCSWTREEISLTVERNNNGEFIDWDYWASLSNITPAQAARLYWAIDPIKWPGDKNVQGTLPDDLSKKITQFVQWLESRSMTWRLADLVDAVGQNNASFGMIQAVKRQRADEAAKRSLDIQPLEPLTEEQRQDYNNRVAWTWVDAIYILQNYKPVYQLITEQVRGHFPQLVHDFTQSIQLGNIGKEINQAGQRTYIDTPANWEAFWQSINKTSTEQQAETMGDAGTDSQGDTEPAKVGRNQKRMNTLNAWYLALCTKHQNNVELITGEINRLTNAEIIEQLASLEPQDEKHLWVSGADRWIKDNGASVWGFKKIQGGKSKQL